MKSHSFFLILLFVFNTSNLIGQYYRPIEEINLSSGLPSNEVYDLAEDSIGRIYACTDNGVAILSGPHIKLVNLKGVSPVVLGAELDAHGNVWCWTVKGEIFKIVENRASFGIEVWVTTEENPLTYVLFDITVTDNHIRLSSGLEYASFIRLENQKVKLESKRMAKEHEVTIISGQKSLHAYGALQQDSIQVNFNRSVKKTPWIKVARSARNSYKCSSSNGQYFVHCNNKLIGLDSINLSVKELEFDEPLTPSLSISKDGKLWQGTISEGAYLIDLDFKHKTHFNLNGNSVTSVIDTKEGGIFFATLESGILFLKIPASYTIPFSDQEQVLKVFSTKSHLFITEYGGKLNRLSFKNGIWTKELLYVFKREIQNVKELTPEEILVQEAGVYRCGIQNSQFKYVLEYPKYPFTPITVIPEGFLYWKDDSSSIKVKYKNSAHTLRVQRETDYGVYFGNFNSAFFYSKEHSVSVLNPDSSIDFRGAIALNADTTLLIGKGSGTFLYKKEKRISILSSNYPTENVVNLVNFGASTWLATKNNVLRLDSLTLDNIWFTSFKELIGLKNDPIQNLNVWKDWLVVSATSKVLLIHKRDLERLTTPPLINSCNIITQDSLYHFTHVPVILPSLKSGITMKPFVSGSPVTSTTNFRYAIPGLSIEWVIIKKDEIFIPSLPFGKHEIKIQTKDVLGNWSESYSVYLEVKPPFYLTWWFLVLIVIGVTTLVSFLINRRLNRLRLKSQMELEILESKNLAMSVQLNPHFMFNSINSVIESIVKGDARSSLKFLNRFSTLMRFVFESSQNKLVDLSGEIDAAKNYLELESIRLKKTINLRLENTTELSLKDLQIPPLVLQPILENSVWHGLINVEEGELLIEMTIKSDKWNSLLITIKDNGQVSKNTLTRKKNKERMSSTQLIQQRFELLSRYYSKTFKMVTFKLSPGYEVRLTFPLISKNKSIDESNSR